MTEIATAPPTAERREHWRWLLALGALFLILGLASVGIAALLQLSSLLIFGPMLLISSLIQFVTCCMTERRQESRLHFAAAGLEAFLGFALMMYPPEGILGVVALVATFFIVTGIVRLARALAAESRGRGLAVVNGVAAVLLGLSVWVGGPAAKLGFVALCIAADFFCRGVSWSLFALAERRDAQATPA